MIKNVLFIKYYDSIVFNLNFKTKVIFYFETQGYFQPSRKKHENEISLRNIRKYYK